MSMRSLKNVMIGDKSLEQILSRYREYLDAMKSFTYDDDEKYPEIMKRLKKEISKFKDLPLVNRMTQPLSISETMILSLHGLDLHNVDLHDANLSQIDFSNVNLDKANLSGANLSKSILSFVSMNHTNLNKANLDYVYMHQVISSGAKLTNVFMPYCIIEQCAFYYCDFHSSFIGKSSIYNSVFDNCNCDHVEFCSTIFDGSFISTSTFVRANLLDASLEKLYIGDDLNRIYSEAINVPNIPYKCPVEGSFIGWKKVYTSNFDHDEWYLIKLEIPAVAKRSSSISNKCRCSMAKVVGIYDKSGNPTEIKSIINKNSNRHTEYNVGEYVYPDSFDEDRWKECTHGIHFFIDKEEAMNYCL